MFSVAEHRRASGYQIYCVLDAPRRYPNGASFRLRHDTDYSHFEWGDGIILGTLQLVTEEQELFARARLTSPPMLDLPRTHARPEDRRIDEIYRTCNQAMHLDGVCDNRSCFPITGWPAADQLTRCMICPGPEFYDHIGLDIRPDMGQRASESGGWAYPVNPGP